MNRIFKLHWFTYLLSVILFAFMFLMLYVTLIAFSRLSGVAKVDMAQAQHLRIKSESSQIQLKE